MNKNEALYLAFLLFLRFGLSSCVSVREYEGQHEAAVVKELYLARIASFDSAVQHLVSDGESFAAGRTSLLSLREQFVECRQRYKHCETFAEYFTAGTAKQINGAARDEVEENDPNQIVRHAEGLQVIESLLFPSYDTRDSAALLTLLRDLKGNTVKLATLARSHPFTDRHIFDAVRLGIVRVVALGITGFDAMSVQTSIPEARETVRSLQEILAAYSGKDRETFERLSSKFEAASRYLEANPEFGPFDRAEFIRTYVNPLSREVAVFQGSVGVPYFEHHRALRQTAQTMFDKDAFDAGFYAPRYRRASRAELELGHILFFDPVLSKNNRRACASCHDPAQAFTDGKPRSIAFDFQGDVGRNSPTLVNAALQRSYFYDSRVVYLEDQISAVMVSHKEFACPPEAVVAKLTTSEEYGMLFKQAFPDDRNPINVVNLKTALASFVRSLINLNSPFDLYIRGESHTLPAEAVRGFNLFAGKARCATCHFVPLFNGTVPPNFDKSEFEILGVLDKPDTTGMLDGDEGRMSVDGITLNRHGFKTPTVRNAGRTAPFMHNGAYATLEQVLDFYNHGGAAGIGRDVPNQTLPPERLNLTHEEMKDIIAFIHSLTDVPVDRGPRRLPAFSHARFATRVIGGEY